ncbi:MAG: AmmeMemoRadiSam system protein A [Planctomycetota bacterium]|nr:MAG: AmmeMemoRadiSam system protein A [Planctomycetota bacterium]
MDENQQQALLIFVRETVRNYLTGQPLPPLPETRVEVRDFGGMFVTLKNKGQLRGCMGQFNPDTGMFETAQKVAVSSLQDIRFQNNPITADEMTDLDIEISVLSPMKETDDPLSLEIGVHGIYIRKGLKGGCFLPQVATEQKWDKEQFLSYCCSGKAGLPPNAWKEHDTKVYLFSAQIISEKH